MLVLKEDFGFIAKVWHYDTYLTSICFDCIRTTPIQKDTNVWSRFTDVDSSVILTITQSMDTAMSQEVIKVTVA